MAVAITTQAVNVLNLYLWEALKANLGMLETDYGTPGKIPIIPAGQEPDFTNIDKPFLVYGFSEDYGSEHGALRSGTLTYAIYSSSVASINSILNVLTTVLAEDDTARRANGWSSRNSALIGVTFTNIRIIFGEGAAPADQEGGREMGTLTIGYDFKTYYAVKKYNVTTNTWV